MLLTLRYLAIGKMQLWNGDNMVVSQSSNLRAIARTLENLSSDRVVQCFIKFPMQAYQIRDNQEKFFYIAGFPGIVGAIDGTHIRLLLSMRISL